MFSLPRACFEYNTVGSRRALLLSPWQPGQKHVAPSYYEILGVSEHATIWEIEAAFKSKASEVHPDRVSPVNPYLKNIAAEAFKNLSEAKAVLLDAAKRQKYDAELAYSRGSSVSQSPGGEPATAALGASAPAPAAASTTRALGPFLWLVNRPAGLFTLSIACASLLLVAGIVLYRASLSPEPARTHPAMNSPQNPGAADSCKSETVLHCTDGMAIPPATPMTESPQKKKESHSVVKPHTNAGNAPSPAHGSKAGASRTITLWRSSEPPDLSRLTSAKRQAIEEACSYAKLMEGPEIYNGCLAKELALRSQEESHKN
jgi:hypothetical protein